MSEVFIGTELLGRGAMTKAKLRWNYCSIFPNVYVHRSKATAPSLWRNTIGAWLWTGRDGVIAGRAAAALHGALWVDAGTPIEMIWRSGRPPWPFQPLRLLHLRVHATKSAEPLAATGRRHADGHPGIL